VKILLVHNRYRSASPSGEDRVVDQEGALLRAHGHAVENFERVSDHIPGWSLARKALLPAQVMWSEQARRSLVETLRSVEPDVVHVHNTFPLLSPSVLYACRAERVPVVVTLHNYRLVCPTGELFRDGAICHDCVDRRLPLPAARHGCYRGSTLATLPLAGALVAHRRAWREMVSAYVFLSNAQRDIIPLDAVPEARSFVKPNFVPLTPAPDVSSDHMVVYAGRMAGTKGIPLLMEAWERYSSGARERPLRLVVVGGGPRHHPRPGRTGADIEFRGVLSRADCASVMARSRAVIVPSAWEETFGLVAVEAMAAGVPPVASAHGAFPELITNGIDGVLFEPGNAGALADVLRDIEVQPELYARFGRAARRTYEHRFTPEANVEQLLAIYQFSIENPAH
jgi:glycosyltransferase involved in cell wall biosynthesis